MKKHKIRDGRDGAAGINGTNGKDGTNGWSVYEKLVLEKLSSHDKFIVDTYKQVQTTNERLADFKLVALKAIDDHKTSCIIVAELPKLASDIAVIKTSVIGIQQAEKDIGDLRVNVGQLQIKSGVWGMLGGIITLVLLFIGVWVKADLSSKPTPKYPASVAAEVIDSLR